MMLEGILRRDRIVVIAALVIVTALSWLYVLSGAGMSMSAVEMTRMADMVDMAGAPAAWTPGYFVLMFFMWWIMMIAMMLPSAAPTILLAGAINRRSQQARSPYGPAGLFTLGYLLAWAAFSLVAVAAQWLLQELGLLTGMLRTGNNLFAAGLLLAAAIWQFSPLKRACLTSCRSPIYLLTRRHRPGAVGALRMGIENGAYCLGCCWLLMALLFVVGVMNLLWVAVITLFVFGEKLLRGGAWIARISGVAMAAYGIWLVAQA